MWHNPVLRREDRSMVEDELARLDPKTVQGMKYLRRFFHLFDHLKDAGCERDRAGNRELYYSQYAALMLLALFNPMLQALRSISRISALNKVKKLLGAGRVSIGSLSESVRVFDPQLLVPIIQELLSRIPHSPRGKTFQNIPEELARKLVAADGSSLRALPQIVAAAYGTGKWKLHLQFHVLSGVPIHAEMQPDEVGGEADERNVLARNLRSFVMYILDRGYERYKLMQDIVDHHSDYLIRAQERPAVVVESRPISPEAAAVGVLRDEIVVLGKSRSEVGAIRHTVRRIVIAGDNEPQQPGFKGRERRQEVVLLTNLIDVPAEILAAIYRLRWQIELFFRFFKHVLGCRTLFSTKAEGVAIQVYCALIAALILTLVVGRSVGREAFELLCWYIQGWATEEELLDGIAKLTAAKKKK
jgi:hypothetical protein